ncbi:EfeM/EfeO family lipoprotein [Salmonella enterica]|nr:EfeM/EfeO family lipoprotein [Salmonella enterica]EMD3917942.1 EfeM/EfeO family lipoprotein [Salmonella enterica]
MYKSSFRGKKSVVGIAVITVLLSFSACASAQTSSAGEASQVNITLTDADGGTCLLNNTSVPAGPVTFTVENKTATSITEVELLSHNRILGEKENLAPGLPPVKFTLTLDGGEYQIYCPGASKEMISFNVTGKTRVRTADSTDALLKEGAKGYGMYVSGVVDAMVEAVNNLAADINAGNIEQAKNLYPQAHAFYERIESDVEGFILTGFEVTDNAGNLDYLIDMRASNLDPAVGWHGFHAIERDLFQQKKITDNTRKLATELQDNVHKLEKLAKALTYKPEDLANGAADLLEEVENTKITGEEEAFSHYDLVDFAGNVEGAQQAFAYLKPGLEKIDPDLTRQVSGQFEAVHNLLNEYRDPKIPGGFRIYTEELKASDGKKLSQSVQALHEPLSKIAEKVATHGGV